MDTDLKLSSPLLELIGHPPLTGRANATFQTIRDNDNSGFSYRQGSGVRKWKSEWLLQRDGRAGRAGDALIKDEEKVTAEHANATVAAVLTKDVPGG